MESFYDQEGACIASKIHILNRTSTVEHHLYFEDSFTDYNIVSADGGKTHRFAEVANVEHVDEDTTDEVYAEHEEVSFYVEGIISEATLPPFKVNATRPAIMEQSIQITGLGNDAFKICVDAIRNAILAFDREFARGDMEPWHCSTYREHEALTFSNRLFERDNRGLKEVELSVGMDDRHILRNWAVKAGFTHTEDNQVLYGKAVEMDDGDLEIISSKPQTFRIGDIVSIKFTPMIVPIKFNKDRPEQTYKRRMRLKLRAIILLDSSYTDECNRTRMKQGANRVATERKATTSNPLKRKICF
ncbi:hypothetical protein BDZ89DRAFT_1043662 [Hymenopellis radicata]|nr:hypothetical protein BDZ89DRAFT_1043662 [Hymenopellis radicata]